MVDVADKANIGQEISAALPALGTPNYDQATRVAFLFLSKSVNGNTYVDFETSVKSVSLAPGDIIALTYSREGFIRQPFRIVRIAPGMNYHRASITAQVHDDAWYSGSNATGSGVGRQGIAQAGRPRPLIGTVMSADGSTQLGIVESFSVDTDGTSTVQLTTSFTSPGRPAASAASIPLVSLQALYESTGGTLPGGTTWYYGVSAFDGSGSRRPALVYHQRIDTRRHEHELCDTSESQFFGRNSDFQRVSRHDSCESAANCREHAHSSPVCRFRTCSAVARASRPELRSCELLLAIRAAA